MDPSEERLILGLVIGLLVVLGMVVFSVARWLDERPDAVRYRAHGIEVMRAELDNVSPPLGSDYGGEQEYNAPLRPTGIIAYYARSPGGCAGVQVYYLPRLTAVGWSGGAVAANGIEMTFTKDGEDYHLQLGVTCDSDGSYTVGIFNR